MPARIIIYWLSLIVCAGFFVLGSLLEVPFLNDYKRFAGLFCFSPTRYIPNEKKPWIALLSRVFVAILFSGFFMLNIARIFLGVSILSFVVMIGSCVSCNSVSEKSHSYQLPDGRFVTGGVTNESERIYAVRTITSFGVSFIALLFAGIAYGRHQAGKRKWIKRKHQSF